MFNQSLILDLGASQVDGIFFSDSSEGCFLSHQNLSVSPFDLFTSSESPPVFLNAKRMLDACFLKTPLDVKQWCPNFSWIKQSQEEVIERFLKEAFLKNIWTNYFLKLKTACETEKKDKIKTLYLVLPKSSLEAVADFFRDVSKGAGFSSCEMIAQEEAVALFYQSNIKKEGNVFFCDLGAGKSSFFEATISKEDVRLGKAKESYDLGGEDITCDLLDALLEEDEGAELRKMIETDGALFLKLFRAVDRAKSALSHRHAFDISISSEEGKVIQIALSSFLLAQPIEAYHSKIKDLVESSFYHPDNEYNDLVLLGGSARIPLVRETLKKMFNSSPHEDSQFDQAVLQGAEIWLRRKEIGK